MTTLVTGANGFVASRLIPRLIAEGHDVVAATGPDGLADVDWLTGVETLALDLQSETSVSAMASRAFDYIVHLAGRSSGAESMESAATTWDVNAVGTVRLAEAVSRSGALRILFASTGLVYATADAPVTEQHALDPRGPYAASKAAAEVALHEIATRTKTEVVVARSFAHTGGGQDGRFVVPAFVKRIREAAGLGASAIEVGNLEPVRDFLHVDDVVEAYIRLLRDGGAGETYNVASGEPVSIRDLFRLISDTLEVRLIAEVDARYVRPGECMYSVGDASKLRATTGWQPTHSLREAVQEVIDAQTN